MIVNEATLWPTWQCVPALSKHIDSITANFRICGTRKKSNYPWGLYSAGCDDPPQNSWLFYSLLERFVRCGPLAARVPSGTSDREITIGTLIINIESPEDDRLLKPGLVLDFIRTYLGNLTTMNYHTAKYGGFINERIGRIEFFKDWKPSDPPQVFDLGEMLMRLRKTSPRDTFGHLWDHGARLTAFWRWKKRALEKRKKAGLLVKYPDDPELKDVEGDD